MGATVRTPLSLLTGTAGLQRPSASPLSPSQGKRPTLQACPGGTCTPRPRPPARLRGPHGARHGLDAVPGPEDAVLKGPAPIAPVPGERPLRAVARGGDAGADVTKGQAGAPLTTRQKEPDWGAGCRGCAGPRQDEEPRAHAPHDAQGPSHTAKRRR